jgi:NAD(P)-dependent dehydrogenase (short-subunit alcohol dehydrogenase family)
VNNAGVIRASTFIDPPSMDAARAEMETNYFGTLSMCRAFAPVLADERTRFVKASLPHDHELIYPPVQEFWDAAVTGS